MLTSYMDVNFNKYSNVSFLTFICTVFISSKNHIQVLNRSSKTGAALVKTITSTVLVDYCSDFVEVDLLKNTNSSAVIKLLKAQFSHHGIPDVLVTDNGPQFISREFSEFATQWKFQHVTSSPYHPKSNGKAESVVKIMKSLIKKAQRDNKDPWLSLLDYCNTPTTEMQTSPPSALCHKEPRH